MPSSVPAMNGYSAVAAFDCSRCDRLVRVYYEATPGVPPDRPDRMYQTFKEERFPTATMLTAWSHRQAEYYSYGYANNPGCGFVVPSVDDNPESFIQQLYTRLFVYPRKPHERIVRFDPQSFLTSNLVANAPARDAGQPPLVLHANPKAMAAILVTGNLPDLNGHFPDLTPAQQQRAPELFLRLIRAETVAMSL